MPNSTRNFLYIGIGAGFTYTACKLFTSINPVAGAIFFAVADLTRRVSEPAFNEIFNKDNNGSIMSRVAGFSLKQISAVFIGLEVTNALGYSFSLKSAISTLIIPGAVLLFGIGAIVVVVLAAVRIISNGSLERAFRR
jgi:hypothetical protein